MTKKVNIQTFGCQMNEYDSEKMAEILKQQNYVYTDQTEDADLILLNTCSVRDKAEQKVYSMLGRLKMLKEKHPGLIIGVGGCVAQQEGETILKRAKSVDMVFGTDNLFDLPEMLEQVRQGKRVLRTERKEYKQKVRNFIPETLFHSPPGPQFKSHISITKGCNNFCTFCIVPVTRGLEVSREPENIIEEARKLVSEGIVEICLLGQNVNSYKANGVDFVELLRQLDALPGLSRLRFISPHPKDFQEDLARAFVELPSLCEHMHLPIQSGSNKILKSMRRHYTLEEFMEKVHLLRSHLPEAAISTDLIVGFPGETDEDFQCSVKAMELARFDQVYSFKYSPRPGTPAATFDEQVPEEVKNERLRIVLELHEKIIGEKYQAMIGTTQEVLLEGFHPKFSQCPTGKTRGNHSIMLEDSTGKPGDILNVIITEAKLYSLVGKPF
ncbi:MAG: tRNA (N6-isopentenyl adenosine(37)-C2)-methylthiotransferase MiaB [SAR324 cluster bacterium]|nr:tRNA (N6-isopentenyl adenosine(37)-C2)-methylthiotransferase MiaB [SAR324 cluster bacterium]